MRKTIRKKLKQFWKDESGNEAIEFAILFPVILFLVGFMIDRFIQYEGLTALSAATNEAVRYAITAETESDAYARIEEILGDRLESSNMGWCSGSGNDCVEWKDAGQSRAVSRTSFDSSPDTQWTAYTSDGWCNGSYITVGVRAHKSSLFPSFETFRKMLSGGPIYHTHTYVVTARVEAKDKC